MKDEKRPVRGSVGGFYKRFRHPAALPSGGCLRVKLWVKLRIAAAIYLSIFKKYPGIEQVVLYGSRAKGKYRTGSDIDLSLMTDNTFTRTDLLRIAGDFDDSDMPYFVDVSIYRKLSNPDLKAHIDRVGKILYSNPLAHPTVQKSNKNWTKVQ